MLFGTGSICLSFTVRDHLAGKSFRGLPTLEESSLSFGEWILVLPLERKLSSQSTILDRPRRYGIVNSSHGELAHLCTAEECGVLTIG